MKSQEGGKWGFLFWMVKGCGWVLYYKKKDFLMDIEENKILMLYDCIDEV